MNAKRRVGNMATGSAALLLVLAGAAACGPDSGPTGTTPDVVVDTIGDTAVVRTLSGSVWGEEATLVPEVTIGQLDGPDEYLFGNIYAVTVDDDGRVYVLDGQARDLRVYDSEGTYLETMTRRGEGPGELNNAMSVAVLPDGRIIAHDVGDMFVKVVGPSTADREHWAFPAGAFVIPVKPLRIDRNGRILVASAGSSSGDIIEYVRVMGPDGQLLDSLSPPGIGFEPPSVEVRLPFVMNGRTTASRFVPLNEDHDPDDPRSQPVSWESPVRYDAFEPDGTYLGALAVPEGFLASPAMPIFDGEHVWAVSRDELEVQRVVRYRIVVGGG